MVIKDELHITIPGQELWDPYREEFLYTKERKLRLKHSLRSISYWEMKMQKPFLDSKKNESELRYYIKCMTLDQNVQDEIYYSLTSENLEEVGKYLNDPMTATTIKRLKEGNKPNRERITSELIYYWMLSFNIPSTFDQWHFNRLMSLIEICSIKSSPPKKMSQAEINAQRRAINEANRKRFNTRG